MDLYDIAKLCRIADYLHQYSIRDYDQLNSAIDICRDAILEYNTYSNKQVFDAANICLRFLYDKDYKNF